MSALDLFTASPEGLEGAAAFAEKRPADFAPHVELATEPHPANGPTASVLGRKRRCRGRPGVRIRTEEESWTSR